MRNFMNRQANLVTRREKRPGLFFAFMRNVTHPAGPLATGHSAAEAPSRNPKRPTGKVAIVEARPMSRRKRWVVTRVVEKAKEI
mgnify:CR=1 FL=1